MTFPHTYFFVGLMAILLVFVVIAWKVFLIIAEQHARNRAIQADIQRRDFVEGMGFRLREDNTVPQSLPIIPGIEIGKLEISAEFKCPVCGSLITKDSEVVRCSSCRMPTHKDCSEFNGKCGIFACGGTAENKQEGTAIYCPGCQHTNFRIDDRTPFQCEGCGGSHLRNGPIS